MRSWSDIAETLGFHWWIFEPEKVKGVTLMQFTDVYDMHGKEIYEGDIVREYEIHGSKSQLWQVAYIAPYFAQAKFKKAESVHSVVHGMLVGGVCRIVGNIYENPELLELIND